MARVAGMLAACLGSGQASAGAVASNTGTRTDGSFLLPVAVVVVVNAAAAAVAVQNKFDSCFEVLVGFTQRGGRVSSPLKCN